MLLLALVILGVLSTPLSVSSAKQPNIVFILADDLGYADIGYHGGAGQIKTPVLDQLAYDGVRLENYYVQPVCTPTRGALLAGKWHLGFYKKEYLPVNRGFDSFYGYYQGAEDYFNHTREVRLLKSIFKFSQELLHNFDPLMPKFGFKKPGSPFDNRQTAALRVGDYKIVTGYQLYPMVQADTVQGT
ncbi:hypothetical protein EB796_005859 [Bugula neritina]|uniref:Sulfatase N-terminal domain-containing protein n=1 Tax=Bugula neritina TaxID=10212 RepID=A0A7J7KD26_BUGNE|nr:hypothetical protein EB796_005859 [Bugula neritina]